MMPLFRQVVVGSQGRLFLCRSVDGACLSSFDGDSSSFDHPTPHGKIQEGIPHLVGVENNEICMFADRDTVPIGNTEHACCSVGAHF